MYKDFYKYKTILKEDKTFDGIKYKSGTEIIYNKNSSNLIRVVSGILARDCVIDNKIYLAGNEIYFQYRNNERTVIAKNFKQKAFIKNILAFTYMINEVQSMIVLEKNNNIEIHNNNILSKGKIKYPIFINNIYCKEKENVEFYANRNLKKCILKHRTKINNYELVENKKVEFLYNGRLKSFYIDKPMNIENKLMINGYFPIKIEYTDENYSRYVIKSISSKEFLNVIVNKMPILNYKKIFFYTNKSNLHKVHRAVKK